MATTRRTRIRKLDWFCGGIALLVTLCGVATTAAWLPRIPASQRAALALADAEDPPLPGANAIVAAYLVSRAVPDADWVRFVAMPAREAVAELEAREPAPDPTRDALRACEPWQNGCLAAVIADPAAARALRERSVTRLRQIERLQRDFPSAPVVGPWTMHSAIPPFSGLHLPVRLDAALRFVDGDLDGALQRVCAHALYWRGLRRRTDLLIVDMIGVAYIAGAANGYAEMLAALPSGTPAPSPCADAFAPLADAELDQCRVYRTEFRIVEHTLALDGGYFVDPPGVIERISTQIGLRPRPTLALMAPGYADFCTDAHRDRIARRAEMAAPDAPRCTFDGWLFNPIGCNLAARGGRPTYLDYYHRVLDLDGRLRLASSAAWLREQAGAPEHAFVQRPVALRDARHRLVGDHCTPALQFEPRKTRERDPVWTLPLARPADCAPQAPATAVLATPGAADARLSGAPP